MKKVQWTNWLAFGLTLLMFCACGTSKKAVEKTDVSVSGSQFSSTAFVSTVASRATDATYITAKMKFNLRADDQDISVGGNLKMKKDDVIQLSLVAFGFVEAGRIEFTKDDVLLVDRINKQYVRASYDDLSFLKEAEINFYTLQALFRNALFVPGKKSLDDNLSALSATKVSGERAVISCQNRKLQFKFLTSLATDKIEQTQILPLKNSGVEFNWNYANFADFNGASFPLRQKMSLVGLSKKVEMDILLSRLGNDEKWETRTNVKDSYNEVDADVLLKKLLHL